MCRRFWHDTHDNTCTSYKYLNKFVIIMIILDEHLQHLQQEKDHYFAAALNRHKLTPLLPLCCHTGHGTTCQGSGMGDLRYADDKERAQRKKNELRPHIS